MKILETARLALRSISIEDAACYLKVSDSSWLRYIGDKGVGTLEQACTAIQKDLVDMLARVGCSPDVVSRRR